MNTCVLRPPNAQHLSDDVIDGVVLRAKQAERDLVPNSLNIPRETPNGQHVAIVEQLLSEQQRLRELRRVRQIRYRKKKDDYANSLEEETNELREDIETLEKRQRSVASATPTKENVWSTATEYFRLFRHGLNGCSTQPSAQQDFLLNAMAPDVVFNSSRGPEAIMESWEYTSLWLKGVELELEALQRSGGSVIARTTTSVTITEETLRNVFPHLLTDERGRELAEKLLNQRVVVCGSVKFEWDVAYCRVVSVMTQADLLTPMLRLLGSLEDTSWVFEKALISPDFQWNVKARE